MKWLVQAAALIYLTACESRALDRDAGWSVEAGGAAEAPEISDAANTDVADANACVPCLTSSGATMVDVSRDCVFALPCPYEIGIFVFIDVFIDGVRIPRDPSHIEGWDYADVSQAHVGLFGEACTAAQGGAHDVGFSYRCGILP